MEFQCVEELNLLLCDIKYTGEPNQIQNNSDTRQIILLVGEQIIFNHKSRHMDYNTSFVPLSKFQKIKMVRKKKDKESGWRFAK